jgi:CheY-like chemotaxis protein
MQNQETILIVDDNPDVIHVLTLLLSHAGFKVMKAENGEQGCELAEQALPTLILCDERMPQFDGFATLTRLKTTPATAHIPVIMIGGTDANGTRDWLSCGASFFLPKPFQLPELLAAVRGVLSAK